MEGSPRRFRLCSTSAPPLEDDDLLTEILLRLLPQPSSLPRASAVCTRWYGIVSDPVFLRRFRLRHRSEAPILGCFIMHMPYPRISFVPTLEAPDCVPAQRFSPQLDDHDNYRPLNCRHGLVLLYLWKFRDLLVWDPVTGRQHYLCLPQGFIREEERIEGAVLRADGDLDHFQVVLVGLDLNGKRAIASVYSSEARLWGEIVSTPLPDEMLTHTNFAGVLGMLAGNSIYWLIEGGSSRVLGFHLHTQMLTLLQLPEETKYDVRCHYMLTRAEGGHICLLIISGCNVQLWKREPISDGVYSWALGRTIELDKLLSLDPDQQKSPTILGYAEQRNVLFLWTSIGHFMVNLESLKFEKKFDTTFWNFHQPFECVYTGEIGIGGVHGGAALLHN